MDTINEPAKEKKENVGWKQTKYILFVGAFVGIWGIVPKVQTQLKYPIGSRLAFQPGGPKEVVGDTLQVIGYEGSSVKVQPITGGLPRSRQPLSVAYYQLDSYTVVPMTTKGL